MELGKNVMWEDMMEVIGKKSKDRDVYFAAIDAEFWDWWKLQFHFEMEETNS